jgi:hypothetical protein
MDFATESADRPRAPSAPAKNHSKAPANPTATARPSSCAASASLCAWAICAELKFVVAVSNAAAMRADASL